jgi:adenylosuccinate synthase
MTDVVVGGQFGSEGKGLVVAHIAKDYDVHVRVGAANAGHTFYLPNPHLKTQDGLPWDKHVMQQIPCAAYANPKATLVIGPGAQISPHIFEDELMVNVLWRANLGLPAPRVLVDKRAHVITDAQVQAEAESGLAERIGSTSTIAREGIGAAMADRVMRSAGCVTAADFFRPNGYLARARGGGTLRWSGLGVEVGDATVYLERADRSGHVLLEGTQGTGLSLTTGFFPYVTSRNTTAAGIAADCGVSPRSIRRVIGVFRTYPIRVAGNSGPFYPDSEETTWEALGIDPETERTTVTKKIRRVANWSDTQLADAMRLNGITDIALTFADYLEPELAGAQGSAMVGYNPLCRIDATRYPRLMSRVEEIFRLTGKVPRWIGTGPHHVLEVKGVQGERAA